MRVDRLMLGLVMIASAFLTSLTGMHAFLLVGAALFLGGVVVFILGLLQGQSAILPVDGRLPLHKPIEETGPPGAVVYCESCGSRVYQASGLCPNCGKITIGQMKTNLE